MTKLVAYKRREGGLALKRKQDAPGGGYATSGKGIRIDVCRIYTLKGIGHLGAMGVRHHRCADLLDISIQCFILKRPVIGGKLVGCILLVNLYFPVL
jgi:hypothetical protein